MQRSQDAGRLKQLDAAVSRRRLMRHFGLVSATKLFQVITNYIDPICSCRENQLLRLARRIGLPYSIGIQDECRGKRILFASE